MLESVRGSCFVNSLYIDLFSSFICFCYYPIFFFIFVPSLSEAAGEEGKKQFLQEIEFMKQIGSHRNVLSMLGYWVKSEPIMLILEYVPYGDLLQWLRNKRQVRRYITMITILKSLFLLYPKTNAKYLLFPRELNVIFAHCQGSRKFINRPI